MSLFDTLCSDVIYVIKPDGTRLGPVKASVERNAISTLDDSVFIEDGDKIVRILPNDREEFYTVLEANWNAKFKMIPAAYDLNVRKDTALPRNPQPPPRITNITNNVHGPSARVNIRSTDNSVNFTGNTDVFNQLRAALKQGIEEEGQREKLLDAAKELERTVSTPEYPSSYAKFVALAANHMTIITPFIPALSQLFAPIS